VTVELLNPNEILVLRDRKEVKGCLSFNELKTVDVVALFVLRGGDLDASILNVHVANDRPSFFLLFLGN